MSSLLDPKQRTGLSAQHASVRCAYRKPALELCGEPSFGGELFGRSEAHA
jgi:hypothetical protein